MRMRRRLNVKGTAVLILVVAVLGGAVHWVHGLQVQHNAKALRARGLKAEETGDLDKAIGYLRLYLGFVPGDDEALIRYGLLLDRRARTPRDRLQPFLVLEQALRRQPTRHDLRRRLVEITMELGRYSDARAHIEALLNGAAPDDADLERRLARCYIVAGEAAKADASLEKAIGHKPDQVEDYVALADLRRTRLGQPERADAVMEALVEKNDGSFRAHLARWRYRTTYGLGRAGDDLARARALAPEEADVLLAAAEAAERRGEPDEARTLLERALERHPDDGRTYQALAALELRVRRPEAAAAVLGRGLKALPEQADLLGMLAEVQIDLGQLAEARVSIDRLKRGTKAAAPELLDAALLMRQEKWAEAAQVLERLRPRLAEGPELARRTDLMLGRCYEQLGKSDQQLAAYRRAVTAAPLDVAGQLGLARALVAVGRPDLALEEYRKIGSSVPEARLGAARLVILLTLRLPAPQRRWEEAERLLGEAERATPGSVDAAILRAEVLAAQDRSDEARDLLQRARDQHPDRVEPWIALSDLAAYQESPDAARRLLDEAQRRLGDGADLRLARARVQIRQDKPGASKALEALADDLDKLPAADRPRLLRGLATLALQAGARAEGRALWERLARERPTDADARLVLFNLALQAGDLAAAGRALDDLKRAEGDDGTLTRYGRARLLTRQAPQGNVQSLDEARALLREVAERRSLWPAVPLAQAEVEERAGNSAEAIRGYLRAIELGEDTPEVIRRAAQFLVQQRRYAEADQIVRKLQDRSVPIPTDLQRLAVGLSLRAQDLTHAEELARKAAADRPADFQDQIWLGQVLWSAGRKAEAEAPLRRAVGLAPDRPEAWMALVRYLALDGRKADAEAAIEQAQAALPAERSRLVLGLCYQIVGRHDRAEEVYRAELAAKPDDGPALRSLASFYLAVGRPADAEVHLRQLLALAARVPNDAAWARHTLARVLIAGQSYPRLREALALVGLAADGRAAAGQDSAESSAEDRHVQILVLAAQPERQLRRAAIRRLEDLGEHEPLAVDDQFLLAGLYEAVGDWPKARQRMLDLLASHGEDAGYLTAYINGLLRQHRADEAQLWFDKLEALKPQPLAPFALATLKARLLAERGRKDEAASLLKTQAGTDANRIQVVAALLEKMGLEALSEEMFRAYVAQSKAPEAGLVLANYLGRHGHTDEALDLCERAWSACPPETVGRVSVAVLDAASPANDPQRQRVEHRLESALRDHPDSMSLAVSLAILRNLQERYPEAETLYRQVLARNGRDIVALNNLAWLLALKQAKGAEALDLLKQAIEIVGPLPDLRDTRAVAYLALGRNDLAVEDLKEAVAASPTPRTYFHLAQAQQLAGNRAAAAAALQQAQAAGFDADALHPLERPAYQKLRSELARR
jgi:tetratricopeptide (TPR) repeat protein